MAEKEAVLESIIYFLDNALGIPDFPDYGRAQNGLQVEAQGPVRRIGVAVDASTQTIQDAVAREVDLLLVHHGIFWDGEQPITGRRYRRIAPLICSGVALYSAHLPLDAHPDLGNCAVLTRALGLDPEGRFGQFEDVDIGFHTTVEGTREDFRDRVSEVVGGPVRLIEGGGREVGRLGIVTGGGGGFIREAAEAGLDTLLTGEGAHHTYLDAVELGVNVLYAGHYATETFGVKALGAALEARFGIPWEFLDFPTGL